MRVVRSSLTMDSCSSEPPVSYNPLPKGARSVTNICVSTAAGPQAFLHRARYSPGHRFTHYLYRLEGWLVRHALLFELMSPQAQWSATIVCLYDATKADRFLCVSARLSRGHYLDWLAFTSTHVRRSRASWSAWSGGGALGSEASCWSPTGEQREARRRRGRDAWD
jgi:hypothetical protein